MLTRINKRGCGTPTESAGSVQEASRKRPGSDDLVILQRMQSLGLFSMTRPLNKSKSTLAHLSTYVVVSLPF